MKMDDSLGLLTSSLRSAPRDRKIAALDDPVAAARGARELAGWLRRARQGRAAQALARFDEALAGVPEQDLSAFARARARALGRWHEVDRELSVARTGR
jgi:hypothetical protein